MAEKNYTGARIKLEHPGTRAAFASLFQAKPPMGGGPGAHKYELTLLIPKSADITALRAEIKKLKLEHFPKTKIKNPVKDGDDPKFEKYEGYAGCWVITAKSKGRPGVVGPDPSLGQLAEGEVKSGDYVFASVTPYKYSNMPGNGITFFLGNVQLVKVGKGFGGGGISADEEFSAVTTENDPGAYADSEDDGFGEVEAGADDGFAEESDDEL